jgi:hypothetical protein
VQKRVAAIKRPRTTAKATKAVKARETKAIQRYAVKIDHTLLGGLPALRSVQAPPKLRALQKQWLAAVNAALRARLRLDTASVKELRQVSRAELKRRRAANALAGKLGIANGCTLTY